MKIYETLESLIVQALYKEYKTPYNSAESLEWHINKDLEQIAEKIVKTHLKEKGE